MLLAALLVTVRMLALPEHATIDPLGPRALMAVARSGDIAATATFNGFRKHPVVWGADGSVRVANVSGSLVGFQRDGTLLIDSGRPMRLAGSRARPVDLATCEAFPHDSAGPLLAGELDDGALIATMRSPALVDLDDTSGQNAPVVLYLRSGLCLNEGNGIATTTSGAYAAGYMATIANVPAPSNVVSGSERFTALRWHVRVREPLGRGVPLAVNAQGAAAGADVPPAQGAAFAMTPHARLWPTPGAETEVVPGNQISVAYAIDDRGRVAGMLEDGGRHYAFLWRNGTLVRLDDVAGAPGWRFECAYAFTPGGGIVGIGTYKGRAEAFVLSGL